MPRSEPNHVYYRACEGSWTSPFEFALTDAAALRACPLGWMDRRRIGSMLWWTRWAGPFTFSTTVTYGERGERGEVVHTTRIHRWGVTFLRSREVITLADDGRGFTLRGEQRLWPTGWWSARVIEGRGSVDESATTASYEIAWLGTRLRQATVRRADGVDITQETAWSRGVQRLRAARGRA